MLRIKIFEEVGADIKKTYKIINIKKKVNKEKKKTL